MNYSIFPLFLSLLQVIGSGSSSIFSLVILLLAYENATKFLWVIFISPLCWSWSYFLEVFWCNFWDLLCVITCHLQREIICFFSISIHLISFSHLIAALYWKEMRITTALFLLLILYDCFRFSLFKIILPVG